MVIHVHLDPRIIMKCKLDSNVVVCMTGQSGLHTGLGGGGER